jgi:3-phenylpropionate/cinnamic acid dioxygenase small subunit
VTKDKHPAREMMNVGFEKIGSKRTKVVRKNWSILREKSEKLITFFGFVNCAARARARACAALE